MKKISKLDYIRYRWSLSDGNAKYIEPPSELDEQMADLTVDVLRTGLSKRI